MNDKKKQVSFQNKLYTFCYLKTTTLCVQDLKFLLSFETHFKRFLERVIVSLLFSVHLYRCQAAMKISLNGGKLFALTRFHLTEPYLT